MEDCKDFLYFSRYNLEAGTELDLSRFLLFCVRVSFEWQLNSVLCVFRVK